MLRKWPYICVFAILALQTMQGSAATFVDSYSPRNSERPRRRDTYFIILHTTEGSAKGALSKVTQNGECHYFVDTNGDIYRVISRDRVAFHAGRSMWSGRTGIDDYSIGIEVVGYHDRSITSAQCSALRELIAAIQKIYRIPDEKVLTHSMVAYGAPNRWHPRSHRGRKRCGMLFAKDSLRAKLGLTAKPAYDPDVKAGRLVNGDAYLAKVLYSRDRDQVSYSPPPPEEKGSGPNVIGKNRSAWDIARDKYKSSDTIYVFPDGTRKRGNEITAWSSMPSGTRVLVTDPEENASEGVQEIGGGAFARDIAGDEHNKATTYYFFGNGTYRTGDKLAEREFSNMPAGTRVLVGYVYGGQVTPKNSAFDICGKRWNFPSTFYLLSDGTLKAGNEIGERSIPGNAHIFYQQ
jgi:N-acetyl-anhydromuramyl-L-alanine amidase AmpD